jgi:hypothetical protein
VARQSRRRKRSGVAILDPVLRKRAGMSIGLVQSWEEIVGPRLAAEIAPGEDSMAAAHARTTTRSSRPCWSSPAKAWPHLHVQHETSEIISRANAFLGFGAIGRIRIVQKPVRPRSARTARGSPFFAASRNGLRSRALVGKIEDDGLRASLERLGASVRALKSVIVSEKAEMCLQSERNVLTPSRIS